MLSNGGFENSALAPWLFSVTNDGKASATATRDPSSAIDGAASVHVAVASAATVSYHIDLEQGNLAVTSGATYQVRFWARAGSTRSMQVNLQGGPPSYSYYGLYTSNSIGTAWTQYTLSFTASATANDGWLQFWFGNAAGDVWLDDVQFLGTANINQTITFPALSSQAIGTAPYSIVATATSGFPVSFSSNSGSVCGVSGSTVTLIAPGTCSITATQAGNSTYNAAAAVTQTFTVLQAAQTLTFSALAPQIFGAAPFMIGATASSGLSVSFSSGATSVCTVSGATVTIVGAGSCPITATQAGNATYAPAPAVTQTLTVSPANQTISFVAPGVQGLGGLPLQLSATATSGLSVGYTSNTTSICTVSGASATLISAGTCSIMASQTGNANYNAAPAVTQSFTVASNLILNGGIESGALSPWALFVTSDGQASASAAVDSTVKADGSYSAHVTVASPGTAIWHIDLEEGKISLTAGATYRVQFLARADSSRSIEIVTQGWAPNYSKYGLDKMTSIGTTWSLYSLTFTAPVTATDGRLEFWFGNTAGNIWLDDIQLFLAN